ncbi:MAG: hypothetical protein D6729_17560 [Deltaproteobacteria bacterium]|nr:MAG: hypothetical protein D6729_17560 [Deltaproteobacteria bacterium]
MGGGHLGPDPEDPDTYQWLPLARTVEAPVRAVLLLDRGGDGVRPVPPAAGAEALLASAFNLPELGAVEALRLAAAAAEAAGVFEVGTHDPHAAAQWLARHLGAGCDVAGEAERGHR